MRLHDRHSSAVQLTEAGVPQGLEEIFGQPAADIEAAVRQLLEDDDGDAEVDLRYFRHLDDWIMSVYLVALMHAIKGLKVDDAIKVAKVVSRKLYLPGNEHRWVWARHRLKKLGLKQMMNTVRSELTRGIQNLEKL